MEFVNQVIQGHIEYYKFCQEVENGEVLRDLKLMKELGAKEMGKILSENGKEIWSSIKALLSHPEGRGMLAANLLIPNPGKAGKIEKVLKANNIKFIKREWTPLNGPGPLGEHIAKTFRGATYTERVLTEEMILYRVYGGEASQFGTYWSSVPQKGGLQSQIDLGLISEWGNQANQMIKIKVPKGVTVFEGVASSQVGIKKPFEARLGGSSQVYLPKVDPKWKID